MYVAKWSPVTSTYTWVLSAANGYTVFGSRIALSGNSLYVVGRFSGSYVFLGSQLVSYADNGYPASSTDGFLAKITDAGSSASFTWAKRLGGPANDNANALAVSGNTIYVAGSYADSGTFGGINYQLPGSFPLTSSGDSDIYVAKFTDAGSTGTINWVVGAGGTNADAASGLAPNGSNLYLSGGFQGSSTFGSKTLTSAGDFDGFVARLTDTGSSATFGWVQQVSDPSYEYVTDLALGGGNLYAVGASGSAAWVVGNLPLTNAGGSSGTYDAYVAKLTEANNSSTAVWAQRLGGPLTENVGKPAIKGNKVYLVGSFGNSSNGTGTSQATFGSTTITSAGKGDLYVTRLTDAGSTGDFDWVLFAGGPGDDVGSALTLTGSRGYVGGSSGSAAVGFGALTLANPAPNAVSFFASFAT